MPSEKLMSFDCLLINYGLHNQPQPLPSTSVDYKLYPPPRAVQGILLFELYHHSPCSESLLGGIYLFINLSMPTFSYCAAELSSCILICI